MKQGYIYMLASKRNGTLYIGVTSDLHRRIGQHKSGSFGGFTKQYNVKTLVHVEEYPTIKEAIAREKAMKKWRRGWKMNNPAPRGEVSGTC